MFRKRLVPSIGRVSPNGECPGAQNPAGLRTPGPQHLSRYVACLEPKISVQTPPPGNGGWLESFFKKPNTLKETPDPKPATSPSTAEPKPAAASSPTTEPTLAASPLLTADEALTPVVKTSTKRKPLSTETKSSRFQENIEFMKARLRRRPDPKMSKIAKTTWIHTLGVCQSEEDLRKLMELFPLWRAMNKRFDGALSEAFICKLPLFQKYHIDLFTTGRCIALKKPEIAIEIFGNFAKYNIPLTLPGARKLLHATYETHPLVIPVTVSSFFKPYRLPPIEKDLPCCSMLLSACLRDGSENAMVIAENLTTSLKSVLTRVEPMLIPKDREMGDNMSSLWTKWALRKIEEKLSSREGGDVEWLHEWRVKSGHVATA